ncbi:hypothetical protein JCM5353_006932 [Sporobolomyces roseus]
MLFFYKPQTRKLDFNPSTLSQEERDELDYFGTVALPRNFQAQFSPRGLDVLCKARNLDDRWRTRLAVVGWGVGLVVATTLRLGQIANCRLLPPPPWFGLEAGAFARTAMNFRTKIREELGTRWRNPQSWTKKSMGKETLKFGALGLAVGYPTSLIAGVLGEVLGHQAFFSELDSSFAHESILNARHYAQVVTMRHFLEVSGRNVSLEAMRALWPTSIIALGDGGLYVPIEGEEEETDPQSEEKALAARQYTQEEQQQVQDLAIRWWMVTAGRSDIRSLVHNMKLEGRGESTRWIELEA